MTETPATTDAELVERLTKERDDYAQAAEVEAGLRREFLDRALAAERQRDDLKAALELQRENARRRVADRPGDEYAQGRLDEINDALVTLSRLSSEAVSKEEWRDIESAPKDGTRFLACGGGLLERTEICAYNERVGAWSCEIYILDDTDHEPEGYNRPTHWLPLPQPPRLSSEAVSKEESRG